MPELAGYAARTKAIVDSIKEAHQLGQDAVDRIELAVEADTRIGAGSGGRPRPRQKK